MSQPDDTNKNLSQLLELETPQYSQLNFCNNNYEDLNFGCNFDSTYVAASWVVLFFLRFSRTNPICSIRLFL
jgi:hypothetical protein